MPLNMKSMQDHALKKRHWGSRKPLGVWDAFARLPNYQQEILLKFIVKRKKELYGYTGDNHPQSPQLVLISLHVAKHRSQRFLEALKRFRDFDIRNGPNRSTLFIVIARVTGPFTNGPEPLISSMTPGRSPSNGGGLRRDDSYYSDSILSNSPSQISSRSHRRSRTRHSRSRSRGRTRGGLAIAAVAGALLAAYKERKSRKLTQDRRSRSRARSRSRSRRYTSYSSSPYSTPSPPPPPAEKSGDQVNDEPQLGRVTTLNEIDQNDQSDPPPPAPPGPPPLKHHQTTTSRKDADQNREAIVEQALAASHSRTISHGGRDASRVNEGGGLRRNTLAKPSRDARIARDTRSRRDRSRSRSRDRSSSRAVVQRRKTWARSSSSENRLGRRYKHAQRPMQLHRKSPERPILRTYTDDGVPPTQRDKAAVAEYYLKKWTTAYDSVRAQNRDRKRATVRSRSRSRSRGVREPGLVEYGDAPVYGDQAYYSQGYYPPPTADRGYNDSDPYGKDCWTILLLLVLLLQLITKTGSKGRKKRERREGAKRLRVMIRRQMPTKTHRPTVRGPLQALFIQ